MTPEGSCHGLKGACRPGGWCGCSKPAPPSQFRNSPCPTVVHSPYGVRQMGTAIFLLSCLGQCFSIFFFFNFLFCIGV